MLMSDGVTVWINLCIYLNIVSIFIFFCQCNNNNFNFNINISGLLLGRNFRGIVMTVCCFQPDQIDMF